MSGEVEVTEGRARLRLPSAPREEARGPGTRPRRAGEDGELVAQVFYNPAMALNRDLSSLLVATRAEDGWHVLDGLAASGARGLRYALESGAQMQVEFNDWNPLAARLIRENCEHNGIEPHVTCRSLAPLLHESVWHVVDVDPYGSPAPFLDGATRAVRDGGLLGLTATDTTALAGVYPKVCERRYMATPMHGELGHEVALRVLVGTAVRHAAKHDLALRPVLSHATDHYYRVMLACRRGASRADAALREVGFLQSCRACGERAFAPGPACVACGGPVEVAGPLWTGHLVDADVAAGMISRSEGFPLASPDSLLLLHVLAEEASAPLRLFDLHAAGSRLGQGSPRTEGVVQALEAAGRRVGPVHFNRLALRTDATAAEVHDAVRHATSAR